MMENKCEMTHVFKNDNGHIYAVLQVKGNDALLKDLGHSGQLVIARGIDFGEGYWQHGDYWHSGDLFGAVKAFNE